MANDFLTTIVAHKQNEVKKAEAKTPLATVRAEAETSGLKRPFHETLNVRGRVNIIAEIKRASPSKGDIRPDLDAKTVASAYERGGAACISVLTETAFFKGSIEDLKAAKKAAKLPVLRKDFIISDYQIYESASIGADAILLITRILRPEQLKDYIQLSGELGLCPLVEVFNEKEIETATAAGATLIGINNRDLKKFETDTARAARLNGILNEHQTGIASSGISCREDIEKNLNAGLNNFLIGESLVKADDTEAFLKSLIEVKIQ